MRAEGLIGQGAACCAAVAGAIIWFSPPALAATTIGANANAGSSCSQNVLMVQRGSSGSGAGTGYDVPYWDGVITSWSYRAGATADQIKFKVLAYAGGPIDNSTADYRVIAESPVETMVPNALNTFPLRVPVSLGDVIAIRVFSAGATCYGPQAVQGPGTIYGCDPCSPPDPSPSTQFQTAELFTNRSVNVSAVVEHDCDQDGYGDDTQDSAVDCVPPNTKITKHPKAKTHKRRATFEFSSPKPNAVFECALNAAEWTPCTSPYTVRAKKGKNTFSVRARFNPGIIDASPANFDWKVKKKFRKKAHS